MDAPRAALTPGRWTAPALLAVPVAFLAALFAYPLLSILDLGLRPDGRLTPGALLDPLAQPDLRGVLWFTTWQAAASTALTLAVGLPAAWVFARLRFRGRQVLWSLLIVPFVLPTVVVATALLTLLGGDGPVNGALRWLGIGTRLDPALEPRGAVWVVLLAHVYFNVAVVIRVVGGTWSRLDPRLEDGAAVLGATRWRTWREVTLPLLAPSLAAAASIVYLFTFTSFGVVLLLGRSRLRTIEVEIYQQTRTLDLTTAASLALVQLVVVVALLVVAGRVQQRWAVAMPLRPAGETAHAPRGPWERLALRATLAVLAVLLASPVLALLVRSLRTAEGFGLGHYRRLQDNPRGSVLFVAPVEAVRNSLLFALVAGLVALAVGSLAAAGIVALERRRHGRPSRSGGLLDAALMLPLGTSAVTIGLGFVVALDTPPLDLRGSPLLVPLAQALVAVPFVVRTMLPSLRAVDPTLREVAAVLGAGPARVWREVDLALVLRPAIGATAFAFAISLGEFGATVFVARADRPTLPIAIERLLGQPGAVNVGQAMAAATLLMVLTAVVVVAVEALRLDGGRGR